MVVAMEQPKTPITADQFLASIDGSEPVELIGGVVVEMAADGNWHGEAKERLCRQLFEQIPGDAPCKVRLDRAKLQISDESAFEPDAFVVCGEAALAKSDRYRDAALVVEVTSERSRRRDMIEKAPGYLSLPSIVALVLIDVRARCALVFEPERGPDLPRIAKRSETLRFDLPTGALEIALEPIIAGAEAYLDE